MNSDDTDAPIDRFKALCTVATDRSPDPASRMPGLNPDRGGAAGFP
jgi:hypothetical protein